MSPATGWLLLSLTAVVAMLVVMVFMYRKLSHQNTASTRLYMDEHDRYLVEHDKRIGLQRKLPKESHA